MVHLSQIKSIGRPGAGGLYEYRGGKLDDAAATAARSGLSRSSLGRAGRIRNFPINAANPLMAEQLADHPALNAARREQVHKLAGMVKQWEKTKNYASQALSEGVNGTELDRLLAFYNSPLAQFLVATSSHGEAEIQATVAQFVARAVE